MWCTIVRMRRLITRFQSGSWLDGRRQPGGWRGGEGGNILIGRLRGDSPPTCGAGRAFLVMDLLQRRLQLEILQLQAVVRVPCGRGGAAGWALRSQSKPSETIAPQNKKTHTQTNKHFFLITRISSGRTLRIAESIAITANVHVVRLPMVLTSSLVSSGQSWSSGHRWSLVSS